VPDAGIIGLSSSMPHKFIFKFCIKMIFFSKNPLQKYKNLLIFFVLLQKIKRMNLLIIIFVCLFVLSLTDFFPLERKSHKILYEFGFFLTFFLFSIKYYYGGDILHYVPVYEGLETPLQVLNGSKYADQFEVGYLFFCSTCKFFGLSFWAMTFIINAIYFYVIHKLFNKIRSKQIFALFFLVILDYNLIFAAYRQCFAVSFFILMFLAFMESKYFKCFLYLGLTSLMHKSGLYICIITLFFMCMNYVAQLEKRNFYLLIAIFFLMLILSLKDIILPILENFSLSETSLESIGHHLLLGKKFQSILIIYLILTLIVVYHYKNLENNKVKWIVFLSMLMLMALYQHYYILNRIRSYFLPILIVYVFNLMYNHRPFANTIILRQVFIVLFYLFSLNAIRAKYMDFNVLLSESRIYDTCTVFERINKSENEIKRIQMQKAKIYWKKEFMQNDENYIK
jgi:hypothetical protein